MAKSLSLVKTYISSWLNLFFLAKFILFNNNLLFLIKHFQFLIKHLPLGKTHLPTHQPFFLLTFYNLKATRPKALQNPLTKIKLQIK